MSDFLSHLAARALDAAPVIQPRPLTMFEPWPTAGALGARRPPDITPDDVSTTAVSAERVRPPAVNVPAPVVPPVESNRSARRPAAPITDDAPAAAVPSTRSDFPARSAAPRDPASSPTIAPIIERTVSPAIAVPQPVPPPIVDRRDEAHRPAEPTLPVERLIVERKRIDRAPEKTPVPVLTPQTDLVEKSTAPVTSPSIIQPVVERVIDRREDITPLTQSSNARSSSTQVTTTPGAPLEPPAPPVIHVTIGRVEVRATPPPAPLRRTPPVTSTMSLEEYLRSRNGGRR